MPTSPPFTSEPDRVPYRAKVAMGFASMVGLFTGQLSKSLLAPVYVVALGLSPAWVSVGMIVFRIYDAMTDPIMGWISDNTRSRWGRRRPYLVLGSVLCALALPALWWVEREWSPALQLTWLVAAGLVLFTCSTLFCVPYESLQLELTPDYHERSRVTAVRQVICAFGGLLVGWAWFLTQLPVFYTSAGKADTLLGARVISIVAGAVIVDTGLAAAWTVKERFYLVAATQKRVPLLQTLHVTAGHRQFLVLAGVTLFSVTGSFLIGEIGFFLRLYYVCGGDVLRAAKLSGAQATMWLVVSLVSVPIYHALAMRYDKIRALLTSLIALLLAASTRWWLVTPEQPWWYLLSMGMVAFGMAGIFQVLPSMNADVVDSDELRTGQRREGVFASVFGWFVKMGFTLGLALPGLIVSVCGLETTRGGDQAPEVIFRMRVADALVPAVFVVMANLMVRRYRLTAARSQAIRAELEQRRGRI